MTGRWRIGALRFAAGALVMAACGCAPADRGAVSSGDAAAGAPVVSTVALPDLTPLETWVQERIRERFDQVEALRTATPAGSNGALARAYGSLGLILMAAKQYDAAEVCYRNATALAPVDRRWPYYLAQLSLIRQDRIEAAAWFERVLELAPYDEAALVWLGRIYLDQGRNSEAAQLFSHAALVEPRSAAAWAGVGQAALANGEYREAADALERALAIDPGGARAHYPLAMAYRALGEFDRAAEHLQQRGEREPLLSDPLMLAYYDELESAMLFELRGNQALEAGDYQEAIDFFRRGLELEPDNPSVRQRLATALVMVGDAAGAVEQLEEALRRRPDFGAAHLGLAALLEMDGRVAEAVDRYETALAHEPSLVEARLGLAEALRASGRLEEALDHYAQVAETEPGFVETWIGRADALLRLGRVDEARAWIRDALRVHPAHPDLLRLEAAIAGFP